MPQSLFSRSPLLVLSTSLFLACGPMGPIPGGPLPHGTEAQAPDDWSYTDDILLVDLETRGAWFRHSITVLILASERGIYIPSRNASRKRWVANAQSDPRVRVRIKDKIFERHAVRVTDPAELAPLAPLFVYKYMGFESTSARFDPSPPKEADPRADLWFFRLDPVFRLDPAKEQG